jgi:hypothetical protein
MHLKQATYVQRNIQARSRNDCCRGKAIIITHFQYAPLALFKQHAKRMRHIILPSVACPALTHFSTFSLKRHDFQKQKKNRY